MNTFQQQLLTIIARHPGINIPEIALALGYTRLSGNQQRYLRWLEDTGRIKSMRVRDWRRGYRKIYREA